VELEKAHSTYREGVLEVRVPKVVGTKPTAKKVEIG
jgi:HSP20 family molecular chaperone IbpA